MDKKHIGALRYFFGRLVGGISGTNSPKKAQESILKDIQRAKRSVRVVSCTADMSYWTDEIFEKLQELKSRRPEMKIEFLVGPKCANKTLMDLKAQNMISVYRLLERPPCDCRIIDNRDTYTSNHGTDGRERRFCWTFGNLKALNDRNAFYTEQKKMVA